MAKIHAVRSTGQYKGYKILDKYEYCQIDLKIYSEA